MRGAGAASTRPRWRNTEHSGGREPSPPEKSQVTLPGLLNAACEALGTVPSGQGMNAPRALPYVVERDE